MIKYTMDHGNIMISMTQTELSVLLYGLDTSLSNDSEVIAIRDALCDIYDSAYDEDE